MPRGHIYVLSNPSFPGLLKIGRAKGSRGSVERRVRELSAPTSVPTPFVIELQIEVGDVVRAEREAHSRLVAFRRNRRREFFEIEMHIARRVVTEVCAMFPPSAAPSATPSEAGRKRSRDRRDAIPEDSRTWTDRRPIHARVPLEIRTTRLVRTQCPRCRCRYSVTLWSDETVAACPMCNHRHAPRS